MAVVSFQERWADRPTIFFAVVQLKDSGTVELTYLADQKGSDGTFSGTRIYGLSKCASAQWDFVGELDGDYAAVRRHRMYNGRVTASGVDGRG